ncbi:MoaD/ThiS family protein [Subtercola vilae]|uniref:MoaD/ThiS family protein n=1 Tax=Subtercola vilae TaxID=2056433 RepID=UPI0026AEC88C
MVEVAGAGRGAAAGEGAADLDGGTAAGAGLIRVRVRVRYFAAAKAAAGVAEELRDVDSGCTVDDLLVTAGLASLPVFGRSTFLVNGVAAARTQPLYDGDTLDVLPPFAGG